MQVTLEGGPWDGHKLQVEDGRDSVTMPEPPEPMTEFIGANDTPINETYREYTYRRHTWQDHEGSGERTWTFKLV